MLLPNFRWTPAGRTPLIIGSITRVSLSRAPEHVLPSVHIPLVSPALIERVGDGLLQRPRPPLRPRRGVARLIQGQPNYS